MSSISDKNIIKTEPLVVNPIFNLPSTLTEGSYEDNNDRADSGDEEVAERTEYAQMGLPGETISDDYAQALDNAENDNAAMLDTPNNVIIKSQTVRFAPDGKQVTDVVLTVPDVKGASDYEVRISKN